MKLYCQQCGNGMTFASLKPKFCSQCGSPISIYSKQKELKNKNYDFDESLDIEEDPSDLNIGNMTSLQVDIEPLHIPRQSLSSIIESQPEGNTPFKRDIYETSSGPEQSSEDFMEEFKKEAGTQRKQ